jgi:hypothetical protein
MLVNGAYLETGALFHRHIFGRNITRGEKKGVHIR